MDSLSTVNFTHTHTYADSPSSIDFYLTHSESDTPSSESDTPSSESKSVDASSDPSNVSSDASDTTSDSSSASSSSSTTDSGSGSGSGRPVYLVVLGVVFILIGAGIQAFQAIVEEVVLHDNGCHPLYVLSFEGMWGLIFITFIVFPIVYFIPGAEGNGLHEDTLDTFTMLGNNLLLLLFCGLYVVSSTVYAIVFLYITDIANALTNTVIQQIRNLAVWGFSLFIYYVISADYGEDWDLLSFGQLGAFILLLLGVLIFNGLVKIPCIMGKKALRPSREEEGEYKGEEDRDGK